MAYKDIVILNRTWNGPLDSTNLFKDHRIFKGIYRI